LARLNALVIVMKPPDETLALGLLKCGVLEKLYDSARNCIP
jgi:hypothetical protein